MESRRGPARAPRAGQSALPVPPANLRARAREEDVVEHQPEPASAALRIFRDEYVYAITDYQNNYINCNSNLFTCVFALISTRTVQ